MTQLGPFLVLIGVAALALAGGGGVVAWYNEEGRRIRRGLRKVLKGDTHALIVAHGRGRGAGFNFTSNMMAVTWDAGAWCLIYRIEELLGVELIVDGQVSARAFRGEPRRPLDLVGGAEQQVSLRLVFDDPQHADFLLELWSAARAGRRPVLDAGEAVEEGNRWLARIESVFRRKPAPVAARVARAPEPQPEPEPQPVPQPRTERQIERAAEPPAAAAEAPEAPPPRPAAPASAAARQELPFEDDGPPWDDDADDGARL